MEAAAIPKQSPKKGARNDYFELSKLGNFLSFSKEPVASRRRKNEDEDAIVDKEKLKSKVVNVWNNVKYGFNVAYKPSMNDDSPIWFLGKCYDNRKLDIVDYGIHKEQYKVLDVETFFEDFRSLIWLTYRKEFQQLQNSNLTTDCGWGCMLRTGQMILANTLLVHFLKADWRNAGKELSDWTDYNYKMILRFFNDEPSDHSPFSLHQLVDIGEEIGRKAGDWYGPSSVAHILSVAIRKASHPCLEGMCIYVAQDCTVYKDDVINLATQCRNCTNNDCKDKLWRAVLVLVPVRLGGEGLNPIYAPCIKALLTLDHCIGIIGGKPKHSLYFVGFQDNKLLHLDPHYVQTKVDMSTKGFPVDSFHCPFPRKCGILKMDPSCCIGFYCRKREDFDAFCKETTEVLKPPMQRSEYPMFVFANGTRSANTFTESDGPPAQVLQSSLGSFSWEHRPRDQPDRTSVERRERKEHGHKHVHRKHKKKKATSQLENQKNNIDDYIVVE